MSKNKHTLSVKARGADAFWRAGIKFHRDAVELDAAALTPEQLTAIRAEHGRGLVVVESGAKEQKAGKASGSDVLIGTDKLESEIVIAEGVAVPLGDIVAIAFAAALAAPALGVTDTAGWNADGFAEQRDELLLETVERLKADPGIYQAFVDERAKAAEAAKPSQKKGGKK